MKLGKISENILKRSVLKKINHRRNEVIIGPNVGEDCACIQLNKDEVFVVSTDPIIGDTKDIGSVVINIAANDLASSGAETIGVLVTILLPEGTNEIDLKALMEQIDKTCETINAEVIGGHTEITNAVNKPVISIVGIGKTNKNNLIKTSGAKVGQDIVMTKWAGLDGTSIIAKEKEHELLLKYNNKFIQNAKNLDQYRSVIEESKIAVQYGTTAMHDITRGGVFGALWELASSSKLGMEVYLDLIPIKQETIEICEYFDLNPYKLMSRGCLLITTDCGNELVEALANNNIQATIIGKMVKGNDRIVISEDKRTSLEPPKSDELYKVV